jgi:predicted dithiol-disulfide oxidoreductase (DUF899 family)
MFGTDWTADGPSRSALADRFDGIAEHLQNHDVAPWAVLLAPLGVLQADRRRRGWSCRWASSPEGDLGCDFQLLFSEQEQREGAAAYNDRREPQLSRCAGEEGGGASMGRNERDAWLRRRDEYAPC